MYTEWEYYGDVNIEYGGYFVRHDLNEYGFPHYSEVVEVIDLESATGADGLTVINFMTTFDFQDKKKVEAVMRQNSGVSELRKMGKPAILDYLAIEFCSYGYCDPWNEYYRRPSFFVLVNSDFNEFSSKETWEGWKPSKKETVTLHKRYNGDLEAYLRGEWLE